MKIAIISLVPNSDPLWEEEFVRPIKDIIELNEYEVDVIHYKNVTRDILRDFDKIILSGSPLEDFEANENLDYFNWLKTLTKPVLGICGGMQVIGEVFGCELKENLEIGLGPVDTIEENLLFEGEFQVYQLHGKSVVVNDKFDVLAKNEFGPQAIKHISKPIYGVLFHPEVKNHSIILKFLNL